MGMYSIESFPHLFGSILGNLTITFKSNPNIFAIFQTYDWVGLKLQIDFE